VQTNFLGDIYALGPMLSITVAHAAVTALRVRGRREELVFRARPNLRIGDVDWPIFAILGGFGTLVAWLVVVVQKPGPRWAGLGWLVLGVLFYVFYRRSISVGVRQTVRLPLPFGPALALEYRSILVPVVGGPESDEAMDV